MALTLLDPDFWTKANAALGTLQTDSTTGLNFVVLDFNAEMRLVVRTAEELFTTTAATVASGAKVVVNGNYYGVSRSGILDALLGDDPVAASETTIQGMLVSGGAFVGGNSEKQRFYFAQIDTPRVPYPGGYDYVAGFGDPPMGKGASTGPLRAAIGGVGPLIIDGLKYGDGNLYGFGAPPGLPAIGQPSPGGERYLVQRSNANFTSAETRPLTTGKTILAASLSRSRLLVGCQPHGATGTRLSTLRDNLATLGFRHAVFLDGSDSAMMMVNGKWVTQPGHDKAETNVVGVAFF